MEQAARVARTIQRRKSTIDSRTRRRVIEWITTTEVVYVVTSLYPEQAGPKELLALVRGHWSIEAMHHIEDVSYGQDDSMIRTKSGPANMSTLTRLAIALIRSKAFRTVPDGQRHLNNNKDELFALVAA